MDQYNRLTLVRELRARSADNHIVGLWRCACGNEVSVLISRVRNGYTKSCGCLVRELTRARATRHGMRGSAEYRSWQAMIRRCTKPSDKDFARWGAKGISVWPEWLRSFEAFYGHVGPRPRGTTLDRYPNRRGNYEPGNVRWATPTQQARNRSDVVRVRTPAGEVIDLVDYAESIGITSGAAHLRLKRGKLEARRV